MVGAILAVLAFATAAGRASLSLVQSTVTGDRLGQSAVALELEKPPGERLLAPSAQMRVKRRLKIRTEAARASLKILLPTVGYVIPTLWLILLGPALIVVLTLSRH